ncbi:MAG: NAD(P)-dependent oxidoreductase [Rhodobacteraceae bacterium]|nr:NAD(P)-dependent oxidoreductase [Paracoccaceae bacterium]
MQMDFPDTLVLGGTGRIGEFLRRFWRRDRAVWQTRSPMTGEGWIELEIVDEAAMKAAAFGQKVILCLAGVTHDKARQGGNLEDNSTLALAAVRAAAATGARVLVASSAAVYGNQPGVLHEKSQLNPQSDYGRAKVDMETRVAALANKLGVKACALRIGNLAGIDAILGGWRPEFQLDVFRDGRSPRRSYIGGKTLARVMLDLVQTPELPSVLNVAAPEPIEMGKLLDEAGLEWVGRPAPDTAIAEVCLATDELQRFTSLNAKSSLVENLVAEWRDFETG